MSIVLERGPKDRDELYYLVKALWGHVIPRHKVCEDHDAPFDAFATSYFNEAPQILIRGSRGLAGKSRLISLLGLTKAAVQGGDVNILGGSLNQSNNIHETMRDAWDHKNAPRYMLGDATQTLIRLGNGAKIRPLTASQKTVRGPHPPTLLLDEIDEMDPEILESAKGQPMPQKNWAGDTIQAHTAMSSTLQYADGTMMAEMKRFEEEGLPVFNWCIAEGTLVETERGQVPIEEVTDQDRVLTRQGFRNVIRVIDQGVKPTVQVVHEHGTLTCTDDHKLLTRDRGWVPAGHLVASAANPVATPRSDPGVLRSELVSTGAVRSELPERVGALPVHCDSNRLQVSEVHADGPSTEMVKLVPVRDGADVLLPEDSVDVRGTGGGIHHPVAGSGCIRPVDALVRLVDEGVDVDPLRLVDVRATLAPDSVLDSNVAVEAGFHSSTVHQVVSGPTVRTWDITVDGVHEFIAGGVVVHNCHLESSNPTDGWLDPEFIEQKKREVSAERWRVEYELGEPSIGNRAFDSEKVEECFSLPTTTVKQKVGKDYQEYCFEDYRFDCEYVIAADWAKAQDFTVFTVYECSHLPANPVYWVKMRRRPYPVMIEFYNRLLKKYNAEAIHDATGLGGVVSDYLDVRARGFLMTGEKRDNMLSEYVNAVENGKIKAPRISDFYRSHLYASVEDLYSRGKDFHLPDEVCSMALGWHLISRRVVASEPVVFESKDHANWMQESVVQNRDANRQKNGWVGEAYNKTADETNEYDMMA